MQKNKKKLNSLLKNVSLIVTDVDGVMTDGRIYLDSNGKEIKVFSVKDSFRIEIWKRNGGKMLMFTGRKAPGTITRAKELGVDLVFKQDIQGDLFDYVKENYGLDRKQVLYVGDDWNDLYHMDAAGISATPADGRKENIKVADIVTKAKGGDGVISEVIEILMREQGTWSKSSGEYLEKFIF